MKSQTEIAVINIPANSAPKTDKPKLGKSNEAIKQSAIETSSAASSKLVKSSTVKLAKSTDNLSKSIRNVSRSSNNLSNLSKVKSGNNLASKASNSPINKSNDRLGDKSVLQSIREQRLEAHRLNDISGPRLMPATIVDVSSIHHQARLKAKEMSDRLRKEVKASRKSTKKEKTKKSKKEKPVQIPLTLPPRIDSRPLGLKIDKEIMNSNFDLLLGLNDDSILNGDTYNPDELLSLMPEKQMSKEHLKHSEISQSNSLLSYTNVNIAGKSVNSEPVRNEIMSNIVTQEMKTARQEKHDKFLAMVKMPTSSQISLRKEDSSDSLQGVSETSKFKAAFWTDFEILLERQFAIEQEALSNLSDLDTQKKPGSLGRFGRHDILSLLCNTLNHLGTFEDRLFQQSFCLPIYEIFQSGETDNECALLLKKLVKTMDKSQFLELKANISHLRRIVLSSTENRVGMQELVRRIANLVSPLLFDTQINILEHDSSYVSPLIGDNHLIDSENSLNSQPQESGAPNKTVTGGSHLAHEIISETSSEDDFKVLDSSSCLELEAAESNDANQIWIPENAQSSLYEIQLSLSWHAKASETLIKYAELIFS